MSYRDYKNVCVPIPVTGTTTFGAVASAGVATLSTLGSKLALALNAMNLTGGHVNVTTAPGTSMQPCTVAIMDGTSTKMTAVVTTLAAGTAVALSTVAGATAIASGDTLTVEVYGTATTSVAAGQNSGGYDIVAYGNVAFE